MARQCKCGAYIQNEQAQKTYDEFGTAMCESCVLEYLDEEQPEQQSGQVTSREPSVDPVDECIISDDNKPSVGLADPVKYPKPVKRHVQAVSIPGYTREQIETIKNTVAKGATDSELQMFIHICQTYGLDPFLKEIYYSSEMHTIMSSRDGYLKVAQRDPEYMGMKSAVVCSNDTFEMDAVGDIIVHKFKATDRGDIMGAWAMVMHRSRDPVIQYVPFGEYNQKKSTWNKYPSAMILKCAEALALKRQFGISGLVTQEELGAEMV